MQSILNEDEVRRIETAVADAERLSSAEILPLIVGESDDYPAAGWRVGAFLSLLAGTGFAWFYSHHDPLWVVVASAAGLALGMLLAQWAPVRRIALRDYKVDEEVHQRAVEAFHSLNVRSTSARNGVLIFISLLEHRAEILCDVGISEKISNEKWKSIADQLSAGIRQGNLADALVATIRATGETLQKDFPVKQGDRNEHADAIRYEKK